jgi:SAM-dependent methyltransferase
MAISADGGVHPKQRILGYKEWFCGQIAEKSRVVDIGSNEGHMAVVLAQKAAWVYGIELERCHVDHANAHNARANVTYAQGDATVCDLSSATDIDFVVMSNVLEHIPDRVRILRRLVSDVRWRDPAQKRFLFRVPMIDRDWKVAYKREFGLPYLSDRTHSIEYTAETFAAELAEAGIRIDDLVVSYGEIRAVCAA